MERLQPRGRRHEAALPHLRADVRGDAPLRAQGAEGRRHLLRPPGHLRALDASRHRHRAPRGARGGDEAGHLGPRLPDDVRWSGSLEKTRADTARTEAAIARLCFEGIPPTLIVTLHRNNATPDKLPLMHEWFRRLDRMGVPAALLDYLNVEGEPDLLRLSLKDSSGPERRPAARSTLRARACHWSARASSPQTFWSWPSKTHRSSSRFWRASCPKSTSPP